MELLFRVQIGGTSELLVDEKDRRQSRILVTLLLMFFVAMKVFAVPHDALSAPLSVVSVFCCMAPLPHL